MGSFIRSYSGHMFRQSENMTGSGVACSKSIRIATVVMTGDDNKHGIFLNVFL